MRKVKAKMVILPKVAQLFTSELRAGSLKQVCVMLKLAFSGKISTVFPVRINVSACVKKGILLICLAYSPAVVCAQMSDSGSLLATIS